MAAAGGGALEAEAGTKARDYEVVIFGATGFTGQLVVEYYLTEYGTGGFKWAIAGRSQAKLEAVKQALAPKFPGAAKIATLVADSDDAASLNALAKRTKVIVTTVGPYAKYGSKLVAACAENGTHYADLTGEVPWIYDMIKAHEPTAQASGARILHCCGFDSEPSDLGAHFMYNELKKRGLTPTSIRMVVGPSQGGVSGGTVHSLAGVVKSGRLRDIWNPYVLLPERKKGAVKVREPMGVGWDRDVRRWNAPFIMASINTRVVARSAYLLKRDPFLYEETHSFPGTVVGCLQAVALTMSLSLALLFMAIPPIRWLICRAVPPGSGPDEAARKAGFALLYLVGKGTDKDGKEVVLKGSITIPGDPGYQETAKMIGETGVALAKDKLTAPPGFLTPASALGDLLIERLQRRKIEFKLD